MLSLLRVGNWPVGSVSTRWIPTTRRIIPAVESAIEQAWLSASARPGVHLFDGPMCRMESWQASDARLDLTLSPTSYKIFMGTNMMHPEFADNHGPAVMANPVGVSTVILTSDHRLLLGRRNTRVAYYPSRVHPFAGCLEPKDADVFTAVLRELNEELKIEPPQVADLRCVGIVEDQSLRQPELIFTAATCTTADQIKSQLDRGEHTALWSVPAAPEIVDSARGPALTPVARAAVLLWGRLAFGSEWFDSAKVQHQII